MSFSSINIHKLVPHHLPRYYCYSNASLVVLQDRENSIFHKVDWYRVVLDEAHTIKSWKTLGAQAAFTLSAHCRWCLTGTPLQVCRKIAWLPLIYLSSFASRTFFVFEMTAEC